MPNTINEIKEDLSIAYVRAISAINGYSVTKPDRDNEGVDIILKCKGLPANDCIYKGPVIEAQLKASSSKNKLRILSNGNIQYSLEASNYNILVEKNRSLDIILILYILPEDEAKWVKHSEYSTRLAHGAYWVSLRGQTKTNNTSSINIEVPRKNVFSPEALKEIMIKLAKGERLENK